MRSSTFPVLSVPPRREGRSTGLPIPDPMSQPELMDKLVSLVKRRGYVFQSSEIYGGAGSVWDYGPLGVELKRNVKELWWADMVHRRDDVEGLDASHTHASARLGGFRSRRGVYGSARRVHPVPSPFQSRRGRSGRRPVSVLRFERPIHGTAHVQLDVPDLHGPGRGCRRDSLFAPRDSAGHLCEFPERSRHGSPAGALRHRSDRESVS